MEENLQFIYSKEFWYVSAFINTLKHKGMQKSKEIEDLVKQKLANLTDDDIYRKELKESLLDMAKNVELRCTWVPYLEGFPYIDENSDIKFDTVGYFQFDVEYYKNNPAMKEKLTPMLIQQVPFIILEILKDFEKREENRGLNLDTESPIYIFATSDRTRPKEIEWTQLNIEKYKKVIAYWTVIYSGQWKDYSEKLYDKRIENNLSNRLSELHFIRRNSGFVYMAEDNYNRFFESYMLQYVLDPTPKMRTVLFALRSINESLDLLFLKAQSHGLVNLEMIEEKIKNLRLLRGLIQTKLSIIYNELDYNKRQHYTSVLKHLLKIYEIDHIVKRVNEKFVIIYDSMRELYAKKTEENQRRTERGVNLLNLLFGAGVLADLGAVLMLWLNIGEGETNTMILNAIISLIIIGILVITIVYYIYVKASMKTSDILRTVDAIIEDSQGNIVLIKRKNPPYRNFYALPGGFIEEDENPKEALVREVKEETGLDVIILKKLGEYKEKGRDPRGNIHTTVYRCRITGDSTVIRGGTDAISAEFIAKSELKHKSLAFDHKKILKDAKLL